MISTRIRRKYLIIAIPTAVAERVRETLEDDQGNRLAIRTPDRGVPCRHCLRITQPGERVIALAYRPFDPGGPYAEVGPIFVHAQPCRSYGEDDRFPEDFRKRVLALRGYNNEGTIEEALLSEAGDPESSLDTLFANERVRFVHVRNPAWGCYDFQVERR